VGTEWVFCSGLISHPNHGSAHAFSVFNSLASYLISRFIDQQTAGEIINTKRLGPKEQEIMDFLHQRIFDPILQSSAASEKLKQGVCLYNHAHGTA
jgi:hypothetical protein